MFTLRSALDVGASSALATRIVRLVRDHDKGLARSAAAIALADSNMAAKLRAELESFTTSAEVFRVQAPSASPAAPPESRSALDRRLVAEHQSIDTTTFPLELDTMPGVPAPRASRLIAETDPNEPALVAQGLDLGAIAVDRISWLGAIEPRSATPVSPSADLDPPDLGSVLIFDTSIDQDPAVVTESDPREELTPLVRPEALAPLAE